MISKITLTLKQDDEQGTNEGMARTLALLAAIGVVPTTQIRLVIECEEEDAETYRDDLRLALRQRPIGIIAEIVTTSKENVDREKMSAVTPMDRYLEN